LVQIDPRYWLTKELDFTKSEEESLFQLEHASCVLGRLDAARALAGKVKDVPEVARALARAWKQEKLAAVRKQMIDLAMADGADGLRDALLEAAKDSEARVRVAAIQGLAKLKHDEAAESILRAAWSDPKEAYGARKAALRGLVGWKVKDADQLLDAALKVPADRHSIAATALELLLKEPGDKARELAALYCKYGQPQALRSQAVGALLRLAKDDPGLEEIVVALVDDPEQFVRIQAWMAARELGLKKALPALEARLPRESIGFAAFTRRILDETINALKQPPQEAKDGKSIAELEAQAAELESKAKELRSRIAGLKKAE
jgi:aminopeptidase N